MGKKQKKVKQKGKRKPKKRPHSKKYEKYKINGDAIERKKNCPKCGPGVFMAQHKGRSQCGKCGYTIFEEK